MNAGKIAVVAVTCALVTACSGDPEGNNTNGTTNNETDNMTVGNNATNNTTSANNSNTTTTTNNTTAQPDGAALTAVADFATGMSSWSHVVLDPLMGDDHSFGGGDIAVALGSQWAYVLDRNTSQVQVLDAGADLADLGIIDVSGVAATNPFDATDAGGKVFVSLYNSGELAVATPNGADWDQSRVDLSTYDDFDQNPDPGAIATDEGIVLVVLQRLQEFVGVEPSWLAVVVAAEDRVGTVLDLGVTNAQAGLRWRGTNLAVGATGDYGANDGGILEVVRNAAGDYTVGEILVSEEDLGGDLLDFVFVTEDVGFAVITLPDFSSSLLRFEIGTEVLVEDVPTVLAPGFAGLDISSDGAWVAVGDRDPTVNAFRLIDAAGEASDFVLPAELPPSGFVFLP